MVLPFRRAAPARGDVGTARLIDPSIARAVARMVAGNGFLDGSYLLDRLERDLVEAVPRSEGLVAEASGIPSPPPVRWRIVGRAKWADANIDAMSALIAPLADKVSQRLDRLPWQVRMAQRALVSAEVGALLGYVSRRVLGQYDLLVPESEEEATSLYFVGQNLVETERRYGLVPEEFALWIALHEVTHRFQFDGVPWLRPRFFSLIQRYVDAMDLDVGGLAGRIAGALKRVADRDTPAEERNPAYLLATPTQRAALDDMQALMAVVEGHGNFVMDSVGRRVIPSFARMRALFEARRAQTNAIQRAIHSLIGLEMKLRQYELGQRFCEAVVERGGQAALFRLWDGPEHLPTLDELRDPTTWLLRVA